MSQENYKRELKKELIELMLDVDLRYSGILEYTYESSIRPQFNGEPIEKYINNLDEFIKELQTMLANLEDALYELEDVASEYEGIDEAFITVHTGVDPNRLKKETTR